jgi:hypothetical protein
MNIEGYGMLDEKEEYLYLMDGLRKLGWTADIRFTTENIFQLHAICEKTEELSKNDRLTNEIIDKYSLEVYNILKYQIANIDERADCVSTWYVNSVYLRSLISLIDEATLSFYRGYDIGSLSILFIVLERYLRKLSGWDPNQGDISFRQLKDSILTLPNAEHSKIAYEITSVIYSRYDALQPSQFYFNRHGLLHGIRGSTEYDQMNCVRLFMLFDQLCRAENAPRTSFGDYLEMTRLRILIYNQCKDSKLENRLLSIAY